MSDDQTVTWTKEGKDKKVKLYSEEGLDLVSKLWTKLFAQYKLTHIVPWMGIPIIQFPGDVLMMQELIWKVQPDVIIECGIAHGGSLVFYASLFELIGKGKVIGVDVDIRQHNRVAVESHPMFHRIEMIEASSTSPEVIKTLKEKIKDAKKVMVILDSDHSKAHVAKELELYNDLVTPGSYLVAMDGAQGIVWDMPNGKPEHKEDNPLPAIEEFMEGNNDFVIDPHYTRLWVTSSPKGYLRKLTPEEKNSAKN